MKYVYPAIFTPVGEGEFDIKIPDLPGCRTCGKDLTDAILMAEDAASMWLWDAETNSEPIPLPTALSDIQPPQFVNYIVADTDEYRKHYDTRTVQKILFIPNWLNIQAEEANINFSQTLQEALEEKLQVSQLN